MAIGTDVNLGAVKGHPVPPPDEVATVAQVVFENIVARNLTCTWCPSNTSVPQPTPLYCHLRPACVYLICSSAAVLLALLVRGCGLVPVGEQHHSPISARCSLNGV